VNQYAEASSFSSGNIKKYATIIKIKNPPKDLRVGMNAEVRIHVERLPSALQVPVQTLAELKGHFFTLAKVGDDFETREVQIGSTNDKVATIVGGLKEGDELVMNPRSAGALLKLPNLPDPTPVVSGEIKRTDPSEAPVLVAAGADGKGKGGQGGAPGGEKGKKGGFTMTPKVMKERYLENDTDKDGKLSATEIASMDERRRQPLEAADQNKDGFLDDGELTLAAAAAFTKMRERMSSEGGGGGGGKGGRRGGGEGGSPGGAGPAGGGE